MKIPNILSKLLFFFCMVISCTTQAVAQVGAQPELNIIIYGDSLTSGTGLADDQKFAARLESKLRAGGFSVRASYIGEPEIDTSAAPKMLDSIAGKAPDIVILQLGETDMRRGLNVGTIFSNIGTLANGLRAKGVFVIVMGAKPPATADANYLANVNANLTSMSKSIPVYPYTLDGIVGHGEMTLGDGYHPNSRGIEFMVDRIYRMVDAGLRWRLQVINQWKAQQQKAN